MPDVLEQLRALRKRETIKLAPSPYLRTKFTDEYGNEREVVLRDYQKIGIMNQCMVPRCVNGDDTGLGKTLQVLSTIGYVWMKEPEYIPIVLTTKSALFQWNGECDKFMQDMQAIVVHGEPHERNKIYEQFFAANPGKRLLLLTYDTLFRDIDPSVVRDRSVKVDSRTKRALKDARSVLKAQEDAFAAVAGILKDLLKNRTLEHDTYVSVRLAGQQEKPPPLWSSQDEKALQNVVDARVKVDVARDEVNRLNDVVAPPMRTPGIDELIRDLKLADPKAKFMLVMDEAHKVKNYTSQVHRKTAQLSSHCQRIVALTATPVKNRLMEFFGILRIVVPNLFPKVTHFQNDYCVMKMQKIGGGRQVPIVVGYKNLDQFVAKIEPYYLSRKKHDVAKELPELIPVEVPCELSELQDGLYDMAEEMAEGDLIENDPLDGNGGADILSSMTMCQQAVNAPQLILNDEGNPFEGPSGKVDALLDILDEADGQKVIIFSRFEKMITHIASVLDKEKIKYVRITGKENNPKVRQQNRELFQNPNSGVNVIMITMAGSESLNLQAAEHFVFFDLPWSTGDYLQLIGRMIRIGSSHKTVVAHHLLGVRLSGEKTIDHHVLKALRVKKKLMDKVAGDSLIGGLDLQKEDTVKDVLRSMRDNAIEKRRKAGGAPKVRKIPTGFGRQGKEAADPAQTKHTHLGITEVIETEQTAPDPVIAKPKQAPRRKEPDGPAIASVNVDVSDI